MSMISQMADWMQVHFPFPAYSQEVLAEGFAEGTEFTDGHPDLLL